MIDETYEIIGLGVMGGAQIFGVMIVTLGGAAMVSALIVEYQIKKTTLDTQPIVINLNYIRKI